MRYWLLDILACPMCKHFPLDLYVFDERLEDSKMDVKEVPCELYCGYRRMRLEGVDREGHRRTCEECMRHIVVNGLLVCPKCGRWYPIMDEIPHMLPDKLRDKSRELGFLTRFKDNIPSDVLERGKPFHL